MTTPPHAAFVMQSDPTVRRGTASALRALGFEVVEFQDECHLYAHTIRTGVTPSADRTFVIVAEPTRDLLADLEVLRSGHWPTALVLLGGDADPEIARRLGAACLPCERPTVGDLQRAIEAAVAFSTLN